MARRSIRSLGKGLPQARLLSDADQRSLLGCGVDPASLPYLTPKLTHRNLLVKGIRLYAANILKQSMLSIGGDVAVHSHVISGKVDTSDCLVMGDLRHFRLLVEKLRLQPGLESLADCIQMQVFSEEGPLELSLCGNHASWPELPVIMGILNVTPDSFSDGGRYLRPDDALARALEMVGQGAEILDIGGESTRPGAPGVSPEEEILRVIPVIEQLSKTVDIPISIDTSKAVVAEAALKAGACIINDTTALRGDAAMTGLVRESGCTVVLMHMRGTPGTMQSDTCYQDIISEIYAFLDERICACMEAGISADSIIADPGIGFGKDVQGNLEILRHASEFRSLQVPVLIGHSRKTFIGKILDEGPDQREEGTDAVTSWAVMKGVDLVRVHDCRHARRVRTMVRSLLGAP
jgi:dihydropteroate synthase